MQINVVVILKDQNHGFTVKEFERIDDICTKHELELESPAWITDSITGNVSIFFDCEVDYTGSGHIKMSTIQSKLTSLNSDLYENMVKNDKNIEKIIINYALYANEIVEFNLG